MERFVLPFQAARKARQTEHAGEAVRGTACRGERQDEEMTQLEIGERHLFAVAAAGEPLLQRIAAHHDVIAAQRLLERRCTSERAREPEHGVVCRRAARA